MTNRERIEMLKKSGKQATEGPWYEKNSGDVFADILRDGSCAPSNDAFQIADFCISNPVEMDTGEDHEITFDEQQANVAFCVEARNNWDYLISCAEKLEEVRKWCDDNSYNDLTCEELDNLNKEDRGIKVLANEILEIIEGEK